MRNTENNLHWHFSIKVLHWLVALAIIGMLVIGYFMEDQPRNIKSFLVPFHKSVGVAILLLMIIRILMRFVTNAPKLNAPKIEIALSHLMHLGLYVSIFVMCLSGYLMSNAGGRVVSLFGINMPTLMSSNDDMKDLFKEAHEIFASVLIILIVLHALAAFKHHFINKDDVLKRMTFKK